MEQTIRDQDSISKTFTSVCTVEDEYSAEVNALNRSNKRSFRNNYRFENTCDGCGTKQHRLNERSQKCPARKIKCHFCGIMGHFEKVCRKKSGANSDSRQSMNVSSAEANVASTEAQHMTCLFVGEVSSLHLPVRVKPTMCSRFTIIDAFPDTGANICLFGPQQLKLLQMSFSQLNQCSHHIAVAGGSTILATGWLNVAIMLNDKVSEQKVFFSTKAQRFFLSRQTCIELGVVPKSFPFPPPQNPECVAVLEGIRVVPDRPSVIPFVPCEDNISKLRQYLTESFAQSTFNRNKPFPKLSTPPAHIHLKNDYVLPRPAIWPATIADNWEDEVKKAIDKDVELGIITKVPFNEPTTWCARMVVVKKRDGRPRRTVDYQNLNAQCLREPFHSQSPFHTARRIPQNTWKSVMDAVDGYHSVEIDNESSKLTTFITPWGRYRYLRFPQGHCNAGDAFNGRVQEILSKIPRLVRLVDDICLYDDTIEGAFWHAWDLLETCARHGIVLNESKLQFCKSEINFAGLTVNNDGVQPSNRIMDAIEKFPPPTDLAKARGFFGLVNQLQWAYAHSQEMAPFRDLVKPNASFVWTEELKVLFNQCKQKILAQAREGVRQYNTKRATCIQTDFCKTGIGYLLLQKYCKCSLKIAPICCKNGWKLVFAGSRFTKGAEQGYAPTEGELLAVAWSLNHAHVFTKGCTNLIVSTDHKPLLGILNDRPFEGIKSPRILRLKEHTLSFNFVVQYNPGKWHRGPDSISRNPHVQYTHMLDPFLVSRHALLEEEEEIDSVLAITAVGEDVCITIEDIENATRNDQTMLDLMANIQHGFPSTENLTSPSIRRYFNVRQHLWLQGGIIMFKNRIVIPKALRENLLNVLHSAHQGVEGMRSRASNSIYWPGLNLAIRQKREGCQICNTIAPSHPREPLQLIPPSLYPFHHICMDAFVMNGRHYFAIVDRYSSWLIIYHIRCHPQCKHVISSLRSVFETYGVPQVLFTDGGLPFQGQEVKQFLQIWKVSHITSSAMYPQANGRAELAVKTAKRLIHENTAADGSLDTDKASQALLQYRNTPLQHLGLSPAQILYHRSLRDGIPVHNKSLKPNKMWVIAASQRERAFAKRNADMVSRYNVSTRELPVLQVGEDVLIQETSLNHKRWVRYGTIVSRLGRKYTVRVHGSGKVITRNRKFLKPVSLPHDYMQFPVDIHSNQDTVIPLPVTVDTPLTDNAVPNINTTSTESSSGLRRTTQHRMLTRLSPHNEPGLLEEESLPHTRTRSGH